MQKKQLLFHLKADVDMGYALGTSQCSRIGKKCNFKSAKKALFAFSKKSKKSIFVHENSLKLPKMQF